VLRSKDIQNELAIQGTRIAVWDYDLKNNIVYINKRWAEIIGYDKEELEPVRFETWVDLIPKEDFKVTGQKVRDHFAAKTEYYDSKFRMRHKNGHYVWVHSRGKVFEWDAQGKPVRMAGTHLDITAEKELEINLKKAIRERDVLLKEVHHRVKNNLQLLLSLSRLKSKDGLIESAEVISSIETIAAAYEALHRSEQLDQIKVGEHLKQVVEGLARDSSIQLELEADESKAEISFLIPLSLIVMELLNNSLKHAFPSKHTDNLEIRIIARQEKGSLQLWYADNGKGYGESLVTENERSSFGMSIMESLAKQLEGSIQFSDRSGACAKIEVPLPR